MVVAAAAAGVAVGRVADLAVSTRVGLLGEGGVDEVVSSVVVLFAGVLDDDKALVVLVAGGSSKAGAAERATFFADAAPVLLEETLAEAANKEGSPVALLVALVEVDVDVEVGTVDFFFQVCCCLGTVLVVLEVAAAANKLGSASPGAGFFGVHFRIGFDGSDAMVV